MEILSFGRNSFDDTFDFGPSWREIVRHEWVKCLETGSVETYRDKEELIARLEKLSESPPAEENMRILYFETEKKRYLAAPLTLAVLLEEYPLAEKLLKAGYPCDELSDGCQILSIEMTTDGYTGWNYHEIFFTQLLAARPEMPDSLLKKICKELKKNSGSISFWEDFMENPFLPDWDDIRGRMKDTKNFYGIDRIYKCSPKLLDNFLKEKRNGDGLRNRLPMLEPRAMAQFYSRFMKYVLDFEENIVNLLIMQSDSIAPRGKGKSYQHFKLWMKQLYRIQEKSRNSRRVQLFLFWHLMELMHKLQKANTSWSPSGYQTAMEDLSSMASQSKPEYYHFQNYVKDLVELNRELEFCDYMKYLKQWKLCVKEPMKIRRLEDSYWSILGKIAGKEKMELGIFWNREDDRECQRELRLETLIEFMDLPIEFTRPYRAGKMQNIRMMELFSILLDYESEELVISCMKRDVLSEKMIPGLMGMAIERGKLKIVPAMIGYLTMKKEGRGNV